MTTVTARYLGDLRVECVHVQSGATIITDAPTDNKGKGEAFSPTDLCATAMASCAVTIMGIYAQTHDCDITGTTMTIEKKMSTTPRRIASIKVIFTMLDRDYTDHQKKALEKAAHSCPVHHALHPDVEKTMLFRWAR